MVGIETFADHYAETIYPSEVFASTTVNHHAPDVISNCVCITYGTFTAKIGLACSK